MCATSRSLTAIQQRNIELLTPRSGQRGTTVEVLIQGLYIGQPKEILFYRPGIRAIEFKELPPLPRSISLHHGGRVQHRVKCKFVIAPDCPLGEHPLRLRTAKTLTTLATFWVGRFPVVPELERGGHRVQYFGGQLRVLPDKKATVRPNDTLATAQRIPLNVTVAGEIKVTNRVDYDYYRISAKKGQRISVEIDAVRLCDKAYAENEYDLQTRILDAAGRELAANDDSDLHVQDPILSVRAPGDGDYFIEVRQQLFKGGRWIFYRAHIGDFQRPLMVYPLGGKVGERLQVKLLGDPLGPTTQQIDLPKTSRHFAFFPGPRGKQPPSPFKLRVSRYRNVLESTQSKASAEKLPVALNGVISRSRQTDVFRLQVKKGTRYVVKVYARTLGSPLDATLWLRPVGASQPEIKGDDAKWTDRGKPVIPRGLQRPELLDPAFRFTPGKSGVYELGVTDMRGLGGERFVYRIEVFEARDVVHTHTVSLANDRFEINRTAGFIVPRGNRWTINVYVAPGLGNRYGGPLRLVSRGLPQGVRMIAPEVLPGMRRVPVQFIAEANVAPQARLFEIHAQATKPGVKVRSSSQAYVPFINHSGGRAWHHVHLARYALGVTERAPFRIELTQPAIPLVQAGELRLQVRLQRRPGFTAAVDIGPDWLPPGVSSGGVQTIPEGTSEASYVISASRVAKPGTWRLAMNARTTDGLAYSGVGRTRVSSGFIKLRVSAPFVTLRFQPASVRRNETATLTAEVKHQQPFEGTASTQLLGLPKGVTAVSLPRLNKDTKKLTFKLRAGRSALLGQYREIRCQLIFRVDGQSIRQRTNNGILRVDPERAGDGGK